MKTATNSLAILMTTVLLFSSCNYVAEWEEKAEMFNKYERAALKLALDNKNLEIEIGRLKYEIQELKAKNNFLAIQVDKKKNVSRSIASVAQIDPAIDMVKFSVYKWTPSQILAVANTEFDKKNYEKSSQFYRTFFLNFKTHKKMSDLVLFKAGISAFESGDHHDWSLETFKYLMKNYPASRYYRGAKLWSSLSKLKLGDDSEFFATVEEFRKKYRNTSEWKIISAHYETILQRYKK